MKGLNEFKTWNILLFFCFILIKYSNNIFIYLTENITLFARLNFNLINTQTLPHIPQRTLMIMIFKHNENIDV